MMWCLSKPAFMPCDIFLTEYQMHQVHAKQRDVKGVLQDEQEALAFDLSISPGPACHMETKTMGGGIFKKTVEKQFVIESQ